MSSAGVLPGRGSRSALRRALFPEERAVWLLVETAGAL